MDEQEKAAYLGWAHLPRFKAKVEQAKQAIAEYLTLGDACVAVSWGKDSIVLLHLCQQVKPDILASHLCLDFRELFGDYDSVITEYRAKYNTVYQEIVIDENNVLIDGTARDYFEKYVSRNVFLGLRKQESSRRKFVLSKYGDIHQYADTKRYRFTPISNWDTKDIWAYTVLHDLPSLSFYDSVPKEDLRVSRTTALNGLKILNTAFDEKNRSFVRKHNPSFVTWESEGDVYIPFLFLLQQIQNEEITSKKSLLRIVDERFKDRQEKIVYFLLNDAATHPKILKVKESYEKLPNA